MGDAPTPPTPHDPGQTAALQQQYSTTAGVQSQEGSMVNQTNPYGSLTYTQVGTNPDGSPKYAASMAYNQGQQGLYDSLLNTQTNAANAAAGTLGAGNYGGPNNVVGTANSLTDQRMSDYLKSVQPEFGRQTDQLDNQLRNQGIMPGTPAYVQQMQNLQQTQGQAAAGAAAQFQPQAFNEAVQQYALPLQTAQSLASFGSPQSLTNNVVQTPGLQIQPANYTAAVANSDQMAQQTYQNQLQQQNAMLQSIFSPVSALAGGFARSGFTI